MRTKGDGEIQRSGENTAGKGPLYGAGRYLRISSSPFGRGAWEGDPKKKGGAPFDAPPCGFLEWSYFISPGAGAGAGAGAAPPEPAPLAWFCA